MPRMATTSTTNSPDNVVHISQPEVSAQMILELASKLQPASEVLARHSVSPATFRIISKNPQFIAAYKEARQFWESDSNIKERIRTKAGYLVEDSIMTLYQMIHDDSQPGPSRLDAFWKLAKISKTSGEHEREDGSSTRQVQVNINLGNHQLQLDTEIDYSEIDEADYEILDED